MTDDQTKLESAILFQKGKEQGFAWFFRQFYPSLTSYCFKITANREASEEIASQAFIKIWEKHERFSDAGSIRAYLYRIVRNDALKWLENEKRASAMNTEVRYLYAREYEKDCFNSLVKVETSRQLSEAMKALPTECSKVFRLLYVEGKTVKEVAEQLSLSASTVKTQKKRGLEALRKGLQLPLVVIGILYISRLF